ncbi:MAG TPA: hypothetical protein VFI01_05845 [Gaiellaceae bacterium]|nr:hypothetical protein [Gaiellaceae bacterium]
MSTVIVAANVVERFAVIEDHASENNKRNRLMPAPGAGKAGTSAL